MKFDSVDEILDFAIEKEEEAYQFYLDLAERIERKNMIQVFQDFAKEELKHKEKLLAIKSGKLLAPASEKIMDLKIGDYLKDVEITQDLDYQKALILAMKAEKNAFLLYTKLASTTDNPDLKTTLLSLAQEEAKHKLLFETEYDDYILTEN